MSVENLNTFGQTDRVVEGWYWLLRAGELKKKQVKPVKVLGRDLAVYRSETGKVVALDAHCPHMGAHFAEGKVDGEGIRCFFHDWRYDADGRLPKLLLTPPSRDDHPDVKRFPRRISLQPG